MHLNQPLPETRNLRRFFAATVLATVWISFLAGAAPLHSAELEIPGGIETHPDGRLPIEKLYEAYLSLLEKGWVLDVITPSQPDGRAYALPIIALRTPTAGEAVWIISGIHGEEPAGPNAIAAAIDDLAALGERRAVVLLPLNNPHGYANNWRYLNMPVYSETVDGQSVGDSSHLLIDPENPNKPRARTASSREADAITRYVRKTAADYPPAISIDLHEDNLINEGYVYSQGQLGAGDPLALTAVRVLGENGIPLKMSGETRFGEPIEGGIIGPVVDSSIDELMSAASILVNGWPHPGPAARTVLVFETPAGALQLQQRIDAHAALLRLLVTPVDSTPVLVELETSLGSIVVEVYPDKAPITAANFLRYVDGGDYDGAKFYRVVRLDNQAQSKILIEVIQGGLSAEGMLDGSGEGPGLYPPIAHETTEQTGLKHIDGAISMARSEPGTASSEFFISVGDNPALDFGGLRNPDGQGFAVFGRVVEGMAIVRDIQARPADTPLPEELAVVKGQVLEDPVLIISMRRRQVMERYLKEP